MGVAACSFLAFPLGGKVPPKGADEGSEFGCLVGRDDSARRPSGIVCAGIFRRSGGELLCPWRQSNQNATGDAADGLRLRYAPPRSIGPLSPDPITGVNPSARQIISGAQNLSDCPQFLPGHWALGLQKLLLLRFHNCAWPCRANAPGPFSAVGATLAVARNMGRPVSSPHKKKEPFPVLP